MSSTEGCGMVSAPRCDYAGHGAPADSWVCASMGRPGTGEIRAVCADHADIAASDDKRIGATVFIIPISSISYV